MNLNSSKQTGVRKTPDLRTSTVSVPLPLCMPCPTVGALGDTAIRPSVCLFVPCIRRKKTVHFRAMVAGSLIGNPLPGVEPTGQRGRNGADSEAFAR